MNREGLTIIELLLVLAVLSVLLSALLVLIDPSERLARARDAQRKSDVKEVAVAMEAYYTRNGSSAYPSDITTLVLSGDLKRDPGTVTIVGGGTSIAAVYADLEADEAEGCVASNAFFCYRTSTGESLVVCKASGTPSENCN